MDVNKTKNKLPMYSQVQKRSGDACSENSENMERSSGYGVGSYKRRRWSLEEDKRLTDIIGRHGACNWSHIGELHGTRDGKQCRERWMYHIDPNINKSPLSSEEIALVIKMQARYGNKWSNISAMMPGRTASSIKNHWNAVISKQQRIIARRSGLRSSATSDLCAEESLTSESSEYTTSISEGGGISGFEGRIKLKRYMPYGRCNQDGALPQRTCRAPGRVQCACHGSLCSQCTSGDESPRLLLLGDYEEGFLDRLRSATGIEFISLSFKDIEAATHLATYAAYLKRANKTGRDAGGSTVTKTRTKEKTHRLRLVQRKKVSFTEDTVDNEHLGRRKSKACCIRHINNECRDRNKYERV
ncbi:UNVERIFIED_CONTAM: hypothetical protein PYX00_011518 [Menopon gallinae]|uniref:MYB transcription factor n=1 Tax=Menopon gallinae TaxID=328185 RepID=A0AAW2H875_9NEOP